MTALPVSEARCLLALPVLALLPLSIAGIYLITVGNWVSGVIGTMVGVTSTIRTVRTLKRILARPLRTCRWLGGSVRHSPQAPLSLRE